MTEPTSTPQTDDSAAFHRFLARCLEPLPYGGLSHVSVVGVAADGPSLVVWGIVDRRRCVTGYGALDMLEGALDRDAGGRDGEYLRALLIDAAYPTKNQRRGDACIRPG